MYEFFEELWDEVSDFFEDFAEHLVNKKVVTPPRQRKVVINGVIATVRPAYIFAERIDNLLKIIFGASIVVSAFTATFLGFTKLSDLLEVLIFTLWGRVVMIIIGFSYFMIAFWKLVHLKSIK